MYKPPENVLHLTADAPGALRISVQQGMLSLQAGRFEEARQIFRALLRLDPTDYRALIGLSAALEQVGDRQGARAMLRAAGQHHPVLAPHRVDPGEPSVLKIRSLDAGRYIARPRSAGAGFKLVLTGGHFELEQVFGAERCNLFVANQIGDNLDLLQDDDPEVHLAINTVCCPDRGADALRAIAASLALRPDLPVINHPDRIHMTARDRLARRLSREPRMIVPKCIKLPAGLAPDAAHRRLLRHGLDYPVVLHRAGGEDGGTAVRIAGRKWLDLCLEQAGPDRAHYASELVDCADGDGLSRKLRAVFIGGRLFPVGLVAAPDWHARLIDHARLMAERPELQGEERRFVQNPESAIGQDALAALMTLPRIIGLDYFGIDFSLTKRGKLVLFAINPGLRIAAPDDDVFPYLGPPHVRLLQGFDDLVERKLGMEP